jgi:flagellar biogenesis protein FliO
MKSIARYMLLGALLAATPAVGEGAAVSARPAEPPAAGRIAAADARLVPEYRRMAPSADGGLWGDGLRILVGLAVVLAVAGAGAVALRRWGPPTGRALPPEALAVLGRLPLTARESIVLVRVGGEVLVVGVGTAGMTLLTRCDPVVVDQSGGRAPRGWPVSASGVAAAKLDRVRAHFRPARGAWPGLTGGCASEEKP